jgi:hypothetical protein
MPPVLIPIALAVATGALGVAVGAVSIGAAFVSVAATAVAAGYSYLTQQRVSGTITPSSTPTLEQSNYADQTRTGNAAANINLARPFALRQPTPPRRFAYGRLRVGGAVLFQDAVNPYLCIVSALSDGEIGGIDALYLGEEPVTLDGSGDAVIGTRYYDMVSAELDSIGSAAQTRSALLYSVFTATASSFRQQGIARGVVMLDWGSDAAQHNYVYGTGADPAYLIRGMKVHDPRDATCSATDSSTWIYSDNPALCVAHAMVNAWGVGVDQSYIDWESVAEAADACDYEITFGGSAFKRFTLAGVVQSDVPLAQQLAQMLTTFNGAISYSDGLYRVKAFEGGDVVTTITDDDILGVEDFSHEAPAAGVFSAIKATYYDASDSGRKLVTPVIDRATYFGDSVARETAVDLPFTPNGFSAQILAYRRLVASRTELPLTIRLRDHCLYLDVGDFFAIDSDSMPFLAGSWRVYQVDLSGIGCIVTARKYFADVHADPTSYLI